MSYRQLSRSRVLGLRRIGFSVANENLGVGFPTNYVHAFHVKGIFGSPSPVGTLHDPGGADCSVSDMMSASLMRGTPHVHLDMGERVHP